jgi:transcription-repair coupling factor (superfamily II helicase)
VGFDLYTELLAAAIRELRGEPQTVRVEPQIECGVDAYLPDTYIADPRQKISVYKRLVAATSLDTVEALGEELIDRFGDWPEAVVHLIETARIRVLAASLGIHYVGRAANRLVLKSGPESPITGEALATLARRYAGRIVPTPGKVPELAIRLETKTGHGGAVEEALAVALDVLTILKGAVASAVEEKSG